MSRPSGLTQMQFTDPYEPRSESKRRTAVETQTPQPVPAQIHKAWLRAQTQTHPPSVVAGEFED